ncbi:hypothetical protein [Pelistega suis]|uniref:hypothetical protein n=1 Tax=Pelistega suis TaxID=1631957 RepID=UPI00211CE413|nr:hypothetical protein [Pelistega suis]MCQ9328482.1 hypothetical protein [Pelistega suis]
MYAPLQQAWTREIELPAFQMERYFKALMVFLACFSVLGWTYALIALGLFCAYQHSIPLAKSSSMTFSPEGVNYAVIDKQQREQWYMEYPLSVALGWCYLSLRLPHKTLTIWRWQVSDGDWRCLRTLAKQVWQRQ